jgi:hypothetical protein
MEELGAVHEGWAEDGQGVLVWPVDFKTRVVWHDDKYQGDGFHEWQRGGNLRDV